MDLFLDLLFICPLLFLAGIIDGIAGGGGIIALPAYIMSGLPLNVAYGCNKFQSCIGTSASMFRYAKSGFVDWKAAFCSAAFAIAGSYLSTEIMLTLDDSVKKIIIICAMVFIISLTLLVHRVKSGSRLKIESGIRNILMCFGIGFLLGLYDGFFGPGGGTVALMLYSLAFGYDVRVGSGNGKVIVVVSNLIALINYIIHGYVLYAIAIPAAIVNILGSYIGASLAVKKGTKLVRKFLIAVVLIVVIQAITKLFT